MRIIVFAVLAMFATSAVAGVSATHKASHQEYVEALAQAKVDYRDARAACTKRESKVRYDCLVTARADNQKAVQAAKAKHTAALAAGH